jgi:hypothetical protein
VTEVGQPVWASREDILAEGELQRWYKYTRPTKKWQGLESYDDFETEILEPSP